MKKQEELVRDISDMMKDTKAGEFIGTLKCRRQNISLWKISLEQ